MKTRSTLIAVGVYAGIAAVALGLGGWWYTKGRKPPPPMPIPPDFVEIVKASTAPWQPTAELVGTALAIQSITLSNEVAGTVRSVGFDSGQVVESGHVLLVIDDKTDQADLAAAEANVAVMEASILAAEAVVRTGEASLTLAESNARRIEPAVTAKAASATDLDRARADVERARADLDSSKAGVARAKAELLQAKARVNQIQATIEKKTIKAPFKGRLGIRSVHPGQYLAEGTSMVGLQGIDPRIYADFAVPQEYSQLVKPGDFVMAQSSVFGGETRKIDVVAIDATADRNTRNVRIRAVLDNIDERLRPGMFIDVNVPVGPKQDFVVVPTTAVRRASFGDHVYVIVPDDKGGLVSKQRFVKLGPTLGANIIVLDGLKVGEEVAADGSFKLRDGGAVVKAQGKNDPKPEPAAAGAGAESKSEMKAHKH